MGIKNLNRFLVDKCKKSSICKKTMETLRNKTIVIDTSIYMYKYNAQDALIENFYLMLSTFHKYNITPLFIFDGKPPVAKYELLKQRKLEKREAEQRFLDLKKQIENEGDITTRKQMNSEMDTLKRQFIRVSSSDNRLVKSLITAYGAMYYEANGEADRVCAYMVTSGKAWACLSDDMDMFVYGCDRVLRHLSLINENVLLYKMNNILTDLNMNIADFRQIAVVSGTDYNSGDNTNLSETLKWYYEYVCENTKGIINIDNTTFYNWLYNQTKYIKNIDILNEIHEMFVLDEVVYQELDVIDIKLDTNYDAKQLQDIMKEDGFVFTEL